LYDKISSALGAKNMQLEYFLDFSKAFDTVNHEIVFDKYHYGIRGLVLEWVKIYFSKRTQFVEYNGFWSTPIRSSVGFRKGQFSFPYFLFYT